MITPAEFRGGQGVADETGPCGMWSNGLERKRSVLDKSKNTIKDGNQLTRGGK